MCLSLFFVLKVKENLFNDTTGLIIMINFIVLDFGEYKVELYDEPEFIEKFDADPLDPTDFERAEDRIIELVEGNGYEIAWSREDAVSTYMNQFNTQIRTYLM